MRLTVIAALATLIFSGCSAPSKAPAADAHRIEPVDVSGIPAKIRVLAAPTRTPIVSGAEFEKWLNAQTKSTTFTVESIETPQDALIPDLLAGKGDIAANLLLTFERDDQVAFAKPLLTGIRELIVTGPNEKPLVSLEDIGNRTIHVRKASDHYASLLRLNDQLTKINRPPAKVAIANAATDEDLLEMVNAGKIPATIADSYVFDRWRKTLDKITANPDVAVSQDGKLAWVTRKDMPRMLAVMNEFFATLKLTP